MMGAAYRLTRPLDGGCAVLLASPHCGTVVPADAAALLVAPKEALRRIEDAHVARLVAPAAARIGAPLIAATHSRVVIDLNRAEAEYDPAMLAGAMPWPAVPSDRVRRGYGLVPRIAGGARPIHGGLIPAEALMQRIEMLHRPWHAAIAGGLAAARARHGHALLIDCHSMPRLDGLRPAELVIGDRHGAAADPAIGAALAEIFRGLGMRVAANHPYAGGHSTAHHGRPADGVHAVQLEFCRTGYMDPVTLKPTAGFEALAAVIAEGLAMLAGRLPDLLRDGGVPMAAE